MDCTNCVHSARYKTRTFYIESKLAKNMNYDCLMIFKLDLLALFTLF